LCVKGILFQVSWVIRIQYIKPHTK